MDRDRPEVQGNRELAHREVKKATGYEYLSDLTIRIDGEVQITTDQRPTYDILIPGVFGNRAAHAEETKKFEKVPLTPRGRSNMERAN